MILLVKNSVYITGRGLIAIGVPDRLPVIGACSITLPGGKLIEGFISGIESLRKWSEGLSIGLILRGLKEIPNDSIIRTGR